VLDLDEVTLVDVEVIRFLGSCEREASSSVIARLSCVSGSPESKKRKNESGPTNADASEANKPHGKEK